MARHFFTKLGNIVGNRIIFSEDDLRHFTSLRIKSGMEIQVVLESGTPLKQIYTVKVIQEKKNTFGEIISTAQKELLYKKKIHLMQCIPKLDKMDLIIQKFAELGGYEITPLISRYTDIQGQVGEQKLTRWRRISKEASIQSGRLDILNVQDPQKLSMVTSLPENAIGIIADETESHHTLHDFEDLFKEPSTSDIYVFIGAEGGFSQDEITILNSIGIRSISLGQNILRTETAPIAITAILNYIIN